MFFDATLPSDEQRAEYGHLLDTFSSHLAKLTRVLMTAFNKAGEVARGRERHCDTTLMMLARHVIVTLDGVTVLVGAGGGEAALPTMRSMFEAWLGLRYIVKADHDTRALAYQLAGVHRTIDITQDFDPNHEAGRRLRAEWAGQEHADLLDCMPPDVDIDTAGSEEVLTESVFAPIEAEWQALKARQRRDPNWYSLFGGPRTVRDLAREVGQLPWYWFLYKRWSDTVHAADGLSNVTIVGAGDTNRLVRPIRHPEGLPGVVRYATQVGMDAGAELVHFYRQDLMQSLGVQFKTMAEHIGPYLSGNHPLLAGWR